MLTHCTKSGYMAERGHLIIRQHSGFMNIHPFIHAPIYPYNVAAYKLGALSQVWSPWDGSRGVLHISLSRNIKWIFSHSLSIRQIYERNLTFKGNGRRYWDICLTDSCRRRHNTLRIPQTDQEVHITWCEEVRVRQLGSAINGHREQRGGRSEAGRLLSKQCLDEECVEVYLRLYDLHKNIISSSFPLTQPILLCMKEPCPRSKNKLISCA